MNIILRTIFLIVPLAFLMSACQHSSRRIENTNNGLPGKFGPYSPFRIYPDKHRRPYGISVDGKYVANSVYTSFRVSYSSYKSAERAQKSNEKRGSTCTKVDSYKGPYLLKGIMRYQLVHFKNDVMVSRQHGGDVVSRLKGHCYVLTQLVFSPDNEILASAGTDSIIYFWNWKNGIRKSEFGVRDISYPRIKVNALKFSSDSEKMIAHFSNNNVVIINPRTGKYMYGVDKYKYHREKLTKKKYQQRLSNKIISVQFSANNKYLLIARVKEIGVFDGATGKFIRDLKVSNIKRVTDMVVDDNHNIMVVAAKSSDNTNLYVWDLNRLSLKKRVNEKRPVTSHLAITQDKKYIATGGNDGSLRFYHVPEMSEVRRVKYAENRLGSQIKSMRFGANYNLYFQAYTTLATIVNGELESYSKGTEGSK